MRQAYGHVLHSFTK